MPTVRELRPMKMFGVPAVALAGGHWTYRAEQGRRVCRCGTVLIPYHDIEAWADAAGRAFWLALDAAEDPDAVADPDGYHYVPFVDEDEDGLPARAVRGDSNEETFTRETAQDVPGDLEEVDAPPSAPPSRPVPPEYTPEAIEAARREGVEEKREERYRDRVARGIPTTNVRETKSRLGQTREYRRIERRRYRARQHGLDPDFLGPKFRLPRREGTAERMNYKRLVRSGLRAGLVTEDDLRDL